MSSTKATLVKTKEKAQYDEYAKMLLAQKPFLARILILSLEEFRDMNPSVVETLIEGEPIISRVPVDEGFTNEKRDGKTIISGMKNENKVPNEGVIFYDIIFFVRTPKGHKKIIINIEAQKDIPTAYHVENRGIFYGARSISAQMGREIENQRYDDLQKVYSIWICMNCSKNKVYLIEFQKKDLVGEKQLNFDYHLINVLMIEVSKELDNIPEHKLHRLLGAMFLPLEEKERETILETEFGIELNEKEKEAMAEMCNLSQGFIEQGLEQGIELGAKEATCKAIQNMIELGVSKEKILTKYTETEYENAIAAIE